MPNFKMLCFSALRFGAGGNNVGGRLLALTTLTVALGSGVAQAQKFAWIDMQKAVLATSDGRKASQAINDKFAPVKVQVDEMAKNITAKQDAYTKNRATMSAAAAQAAQAEIESLTTALKRKQEDSQQDLEDEESKQLGSIVPKLQQIINQYAAANQITFVLDASANPNNLIYGDMSLNIIAPVVLAYEKAVGVPAATAAPGAPAASAPATPKPPATVPRAPTTAAPAK